MDQQTVMAFPYLAAVPETGPGEDTPGFAKVQEYLHRFGYLEEQEERGVDVGVLDDPTSEALKRFQTFHGVEPTGVFDDATRDAMMQPRCALPDPAAGSIEFATTCAWERTDLTFALDTGTPDVAGNAEWDAIRRAFATWQALGGLTFREVGVGDNPDIRVGWRPAADPDHSMVGGVLAHADFPPRCGVVTNTLPKPVHFDDSEHVWSIGAAANAFDIETVALHEIGHIVGLAHSSVSNAVMAPTVSPNFTKRALTQDDIDGFRRLYPRRVGPWSGWASRGGVITSNITLGRNSDGRLELFAKGTDGAVWHQWQTAPSNGWSGWASRGGVITSNIAVASNADGRMEIFARGTDGAVWHMWQTAPSNGWSGWHSRGGVITSDIALGRNADGRLELFARGTDGAVWHQWQTSPNGPWSGWASMGGVITSNIAVGRNADGRLEIFARGTDNAVWHMWQTAPSNGWSGWASRGGVITSNIAVANNADGRMELFVRGSDNAVWHMWQTAPSNGWSGWASRGGVITSDIAVGKNSSGRMEFFARGTDQAVWHQWQVAPNGTWSGWASLGGVITSNIEVASNADGRVEIFARGTDNAVWHQWQTAPFLTAEPPDAEYADDAMSAGMPEPAADAAMPGGGMQPEAAPDAMPVGAMSGAGASSSSDAGDGGMPGGSAPNGEHGAANGARMPASTAG